MKVRASFRSLAKKDGATPRVPRPPSAQSSAVSSSLTTLVWRERTPMTLTRTDLVARISAGSTLKSAVKAGA
ncbi:hypothetical protein [Demequina muriae]|uniref:Uncharacterized protein n=1 Tax=Demequina muriae TaxID=3051664 RepID=A0ABT8GJ35_9MICO|nr:hypothetical protein [Demequina sp. EGI L300058]MDN4481450.1 hypothetical protein [Demequina sp. EGI L300058]